MARYAYVKNSDDSIVKTVEYDNFDAVAVAHKFGADKEVRIIPIERLTDPVISDPATERYGATITTVEATRVTRVRSIEAIPQEEQDAATEREQAKLAYQTLKNGNATNLQVQRILARLLRDQYGS